MIWGASYWFLSDCFLHVKWSSSCFHPITTTLHAFLQTQANLKCEKNSKLSPLQTDIMTTEQPNREDRKRAKKGILHCQDQSVTIKTKIESDFYIYISRKRINNRKNEARGDNFILLEIPRVLHIYIASQQYSGMMFLRGAMIRTMTTLATNRPKFIPQPRNVTNIFGTLPFFPTSALHYRRNSQ